MQDYHKKWKLFLENTQNSIEEIKTSDPELYKALINHFEENIKLPKEQVDKIQSFIKNNQYQDVFSTPKNVEFLYRGLAVNESALAQITQENEQNIYVSETFGKEFKIISKKTVLKAQEGDYASSWTDDIESAIMFSAGYPESMNHSIIFCAAISENQDKFIDPQGIYKFPEFKRFAGEKEIIGIGDIKVVRFYTSNRKNW